MSTGDHDASTTIADEGEVEAPEKHKLELDVQITDVGPCKKHLKVSVARGEIDRQFKESLAEVTREASVPGFRPGHAPRQLIQKRFRKEVGDQVKTTLLMAALEQVDEDYKLNPISQPELDIAAIALPEDGPMVFEMDVEVRPEFPLPDYKSLTVKRPVRTITDADVDAQYKAFLERYSQIVPKLEGGAELGDYVTADLKFHDGGVTYNEAKEIQFRLQPELRFQDGSVPKLGEALVGVKPGESREGDAVIAQGSANRDLRGKTIRVSFTVHDLKTLRPPEVNTAFFQSQGFDSEDDLRDALRGLLERRLESQQKQALRAEVLGALIKGTPFDLPADLVARQEKTTVRRLIAELKQQGLNENEIRAREAEIRANAHASTLRSLKEFFLLAKIAEAEDIKVEDEDIEDEIEAIALRSDESPRRVRARVEKEKLTDVLASQILEQKTIDQILKSVTFEEVVLQEAAAVETLEHAATSEGLAEEGEGSEPPAAEPTETPTEPEPESAS